MDLIAQSEEQSKNAELSTSADAKKSSDTEETDSVYVDDIVTIASGDRMSLSEILIEDSKTCTN